MKLIVTSSKNIASSNMYDLFVKEYGFEAKGEFEGNKLYKKDDFTLIQMNKEIADLEDLPDYFNPELYIIASTHKAEKEVKSLTTHTPGNWGEVGFYGQERKVCFSDGVAMRQALVSLKKNQIEGFEVTLEVTHHGPSEMNAPVVFVEVGSSEEQWNNLDACRVVCEAILSITDTTTTEEVYVGFGGPHYAPNFTKAVLEKNVVVGHIIPKHYLDSVTEEQIMEAFEKTKGNVKALVDWKGTTSSQRQKLISVFEKNNIEFKKIKELK